MKDSVEATHNTICRKLAVLSKLAPNDPDIDKLRKVYQMAVAVPLANYYANKIGAIDEYFCNLSIDSIDIQLQNLCAKYLDNLHKSSKDYAALNAKIADNTEPVKYDVCCGSRMIIIEELSELQCLHCGKFEKMEGVVFKDDQFYMQDGQKRKHGSYEPQRHFMAWMKYIQGIEKCTILDSEIEMLKNKIFLDGLSMEKLNCAIMRHYLIICKLTEYNYNVTTLINRITGIPPPRLSVSDVELINIKFTKIMEFFDMLNENRDTNRSHYPYFIYKIIEHEFRNDAAKLRILRYIHLQSGNTVIENDKMFKIICEKGGSVIGIPYKPTNYMDKYRI